MSEIEFTFNTQIIDQSVISISTCLGCAARQNQSTSQCRCTTCCKKHANHRCDTKIEPCHNSQPHTWLHDPYKVATEAAGVNNRRFCVNKM